MKKVITRYERQKIFYDIEELNDTHFIGIEPPKESQNPRCFVLKIDRETYVAASPDNQYFLSLTKGNSIKELWSKCGAELINLYVFDTKEELFLWMIHADASHDLSLINDNDSVV